MWILVVLMVGYADLPATANERPGVVPAPLMQEFASRQACIEAATVLQRMRAQAARESGGRIGLYADCVQK